MLSKLPNIQKEIHFICIDKRTKDPNGKTYVILDNGQQIILPDNINRVPALLLLNDNYRILYGEYIIEYLKPKQTMEIKQSTLNNMEPMAFSFGGNNNGFNDVVSDQFSFLDQSSDDLEAKGNGGMRQLHNYVDLNTAFNGQITQTDDVQHNTTIRGLNKVDETTSEQLMEAKMKKMKEDRDSDIRAITGNKPPFSY